MASVGGNLELFDGKNWETYLERLEIHFIVKKVKDDEKVGVLLSVLSPKVYEKLRYLMKPRKPITQTYDAVVQKLTEHYDPKPLVSTERFKFFNRYQASNETMGQYIAELHKLAANCDFKDNLEEQLTDRFVCGMKDEATQRQLMCEKREDRDYTRWRHT